MSQDGPNVYDLNRLAWIMAEDLWGDRAPFYYRDFGYAEGFSDGIYTIRPGHNMLTDHLLFLEMGDHRVATDQYGDTCRYAKEDPIETWLAWILADVLRDARAEAERDHVEMHEFDVP